MAACLLRLLGQRPLVLARHHLDEPRDQPRRPRPAAPRRSGCRCRSTCFISATCRKSMSSSSISGSRSTISRLQRRGEAAVVVEHVGDAAAHAGGEVAPGPAEHDDAPAGHVLAAVVADALDDHRGAAVADAEPLAGDAADVTLAAGRAVEGDVADDDVLLRLERRQRRRVDDQLAARQALADVVVGVAVQPQRDARAARTRRSSGRPSR